MADLFDLLQSQVSGDMIGALTNQMGGRAKPQQTSEAVSGAMTILMNALAKNASKPEGAAALNSALDRDHDGSILNDLTGFINGNAQISNARAANGAGILGHLLGQKQSGAVDMLSKMSGLDSNQSNGLLVKLAPIVLGMLGKQKKETGMDVSDLSGMLSGAATKANSGNKNASLITSLLDRDGDGSIADEVTQVGFSIFKNLFRRRR